MTEAKANLIYDVLVKHAGASEKEREAFVYSHVARSEYTKFLTAREWRFCGLLGFGGKFWVNNGRLYISCYQEDETPESLEIIKKVNALLAEIKPEKD